MQTLVGGVLFFLALAKVFDLKSALLGCLVAYLAWFVKRLVQFQHNLSQTRHIPGESFLLTPFGSTLAFFLPAIPYVNREINFKFNDAAHVRNKYDSQKSTIVSLVTAFKPRVTIDVADATAIRSIVADRRMWPKPLELYRILAVYGPSVLVTEGDEWRKHRKIVQPAFTEETLELDWQQSTIVTKTWSEDLERRADPATRITKVNEVEKLCLHLTLSILTSTAFGVKIAAPGEARDVAPPNHKYSFKDTLEGALDHPTLFTTVATPWWLLWMPIPKFQHARELKAELDSWMNEVVDDRRKALQMGEEKKDLLTALVKANDALQADMAKAAIGGAEINPAKSEAMSPEELTGNMFIFLVAGHETSAHTLAFVMGLLAIYPEEQEKFYQQITEIVPNPDADIPYSDSPLFTRAMAILYETLRLYPSVISIPKSVTAAHDALLPCSERGPGGGTGKVFIPRGAHVNLDVQSLHRDRE